ncbi:hypothetical protein KCU81_g6304, partial [Aureobasidium melanogenum]
MSSSLSTLYPSLTPQTFSSLPILETWTSTKDWAKQNLNTCMNTLDHGFGMYTADTAKTLVAILGLKAVEEVKPIIEEAEKHVEGKEWDEERQRWI